jgi:hypothetical protein
MANESSYPRAGDRTPSARAQREEHWRRLLAKQEHSGLNRADFSRREAISDSALNWWARELKRRERSRPAAKPAAPLRKRTRHPEFIPVRVIQAVPRTSAAALEVVTRGGHTVRVQPGFDPAMLRKVVAALEGQPC